MCMRHELSLMLWLCRSMYLCPPLYLQKAGVLIGYKSGVLVGLQGRVLIGLQRNPYRSPTSFLLASSFLAGTWGSIRDRDEVNYHC
jgi:hypothetical protein